jgi:hypothetical protein
VVASTANLGDVVADGPRGPRADGDGIAPAITKVGSGTCPRDVVFIVRNIGKRQKLIQRIDFAGGDLESGESDEAPSRVDPIAQIGNLGG